MKNHLNIKYVYMIRGMGVYKFELGGGKYYFGLSNQTITHEWFSQYGVLGYEECDGGEIDLIYWVLTFMMHYGFQNVRGGYWQDVEMKNPPPVLGRFKRGITKYNRCDNCMVYGHATTKCHIRKDENGDVIM